MDHGENRRGFFASRANMVLLVFLAVGGFYLVSDGSGTPYRCRVRPPCWFNLQAAREMLLGDMIADIIPTFGSVNMIGGECDR